MLIKKYYKEQCVSHIDRSLALEDKQYYSPFFLKIFRGFLFFPLNAPNLYPFNYFFVSVLVRIFLIMTFMKDASNDKKFVLHYFKQVF